MENKWWTLSLKDGEPESLPIPNGSECIIQQVQAPDLSAKRVVLEAIIQIIRIDRLEDEDDVAQTEIKQLVLATIFPGKNPIQQVNFQFSAFNIVSVRSSGGNLTLSGCYNDSNVNEAMQDV